MEDLQGGSRRMFYYNNFLHNHSTDLRAPALKRRGTKAAMKGQL